MITLTNTQHRVVTADANMELSAVFKPLFTFSINGADHIEALLRKCNEAIDGAGEHEMSDDYTSSLSSYEHDMNAHKLKLTQYLKRNWLSRVTTEKPVEPDWNKYDQNIIANTRSAKTVLMIAELERIVNIISGVDWVNGVFVFEQFDYPPLAHRLMCSLNPPEIWNETK